MPLPDFTRPSGLRKEKKEAERRKTLFRNLRSLAGCSTRPSGRARLPAFHRGSCQRNSCIPTAQLRARLRGASTAKWRALSRPAPAPVAASTSRAGHSAGRLIPEPPESSSDEPPPAGTALAPPAAVTRLASFSERDSRPASKRDKSQVSVSKLTTSSNMRAYAASPCERPPRTGRRRPHRCRRAG